MAMPELNAAVVSLSASSLLFLGFLVLLFLVLRSLGKKEERAGLFRFVFWLFMVASGAGLLFFCGLPCSLAMIFPYVLFLLLMHRCRK